MANGNDEVSVQSTTTNDVQSREVPQNLQSDLDGPHWTNFLDATTGSYWGLNMDNFYWDEHNNVVNTTWTYSCSAILEYVNAESS